MPTVKVRNLANKEVGDVELAVLGEVEQDPQSGLVAEELEDLGQLADDLVRDLGEGVSAAGRVRQIRQAPSVFAERLGTCG